MKLKNKLIIFLSILISLSIIIIFLLSYSVKATEKSKLQLMDLSSIKNDNVVKSNINDKIITKNGTNINLKYKSTEMEKDIYIDNKGCEYVYDDKKMVGFLEPINKEAAKAERLSEVEVKSIAEKFLTENIENYFKYQLVGCMYIESYNEYKITYVNKLNDINTQDIIDINVNNLGEVTAFLGINQGKFEKYKDQNINTNNINQLIKADVNDVYAKKIENLNIQNQTLALENDKLILITNVLIRLKNNSKDSNTNSYIENISYSYELENN